jgi:peptidyl-prolyl cis-trans isomerase C
VLELPALKGFSVMMRFRYPLVLVGFVAVAVAATGCKGKKGQQEPDQPAQSSAELGDVVAVVGGKNITVKEFQDRLNQQSPHVKARFTSLEQRKDFLDNWIRLEVLALEATRRGYDKDEDVVRTMKQVMIQKLLKEQFDTLVKMDDISEADMKKFYDEHRTDYNKPEEVRVSAIITKDKAKADRAAAEARKAPPLDQVAFRVLAEKESEDAESKARGGDLLFFTADAKNVPAEVVQAAFKLANLGDVAGPISTPQGLYVIKQTGRRPAIAKSYDEVKRQIQQRLYMEKRNVAMEEYIAKLKKDAKVQVNAPALTKVRIDTTSAPQQAPAPQPPHPAPAPPASQPASNQ